MDGRQAGAEGLRIGFDLALGGMSEVIDLDGNGLTMGEQISEDPGYVADLAAKAIEMKLQQEQYSYNLAKGLLSFFGVDMPNVKFGKVDPVILDGDGVELRIWRDRDGDALMDPGELKHLGDHGITSINITYDNGHGHLYTGDDVGIGGAKVAGLASVWRGAKRDYGVAADVSLIYDKAGAKGIDTKAGFDIAFEGGPRHKYLQIDGRSANVILPASGFDGVPGDKRGNVIDAQKSARGVIVDGAEGDDGITGSGLTDSLSGGTGNDVLTGRGGNDVLSGGSGSDFLNGEQGNDLLRGGAGSDQFYHAGVASHGRDWIIHFSAADVLVFGTPGAKIKASDFDVIYSKTPGRGSALKAEAHIKYKPTGQILWSLVDGADVDDIDISVLGSNVTFDLV